MNNLLREEWSDELAKQTMKDFAVLQDNILLILSARLEQLSKISGGELTRTASALAMAEYINKDMASIKRAVRNHDRKYAMRITQIFGRVTEENFNLSKKYFEYRNMQIESIMQMSRTKELIQAIQKETIDNLLNISHTYAYAYDGKISDIGKTYRKIVNQQILNLTSGANSIDTVMKKAINQLTESGIKTLAWEHDDKTVYRRADSHIRMNIEEGMRRLNQTLSEENGRIFGADGVEISLHALCAPDHQEIQGRQFTNEEFEQLNHNLKRPVGTLNCRHFITPIIMGISKPVHNDEERQRAIDRSNETVEYNGIKYSRYNASQEMRAMERDIRKYRSRKKAFEKCGDTESAKKAQTEIKNRLSEYKSFCSQTGLTERFDRTYYYI